MTINTMTPEALAQLVPHIGEGFVWEHENPPTLYRVTDVCWVRGKGGVWRVQVQLEVG